MKKVDNPFKDKTPQEIETQRQQEKDFDKYFEQLINTGKQLLADERYHKFKEIFEQLEHEGTELIINHQDNDTQKFYCFVVRIQERLKALRLLVNEAQGMVDNPEGYKKSVGFKEWFINMFKGK